MIRLTQVAPLKAPQTARPAERGLKFGENVAAQTGVVCRGDSKSGNKHGERYLRAFDALWALGDEGESALVPLMSEGRDVVRAMAAAVLLRHRHDEARRVLQGVARGEGFVALWAPETLKQRDEETWQLGPA